MSSLDDIVLAAKEGVLQSLRRDLEDAESEVAELEETLQEAEERIEKWQLEITRANARRQAIELALASAEKAFS